MRPLKDTGLQTLFPPSHISPFERWYRALLKLALILILLSCFNVAKHARFALAGDVGDEFDKVDPAYSALRHLLLEQLSCDHPN